MNIKAILVNLPNYPGVYQMLDEKGGILYVGKAKNLKKRINSYFSKQNKDLKTANLVKHIRDIDITVTHSENEAILLECNLIKKHRPRYNILLRDDKSYPYIIMTTQHAYPRIDLYRGARKKNGFYFGPYPSAFAARETLHLLQRVFQLRSCTDHFFSHRNRPCLLYQIGRCSGSCVHRISQEDYACNVQLAILFLQGKSDEVIKTLEQKMEKASHDLNFELAKEYRDQIARLRQIQERQHMQVADGNVDAIGFALEAGVFCLQLVSVRGGQVLGSRSYFPNVPSHSTEAEVMTAFITQYYLGHGDGDLIPKTILINKEISDRVLLEEVLSQQAKHRVEIIHPKKGDKKKWLDMAVLSTQQSLVAHLLIKTNIHERMIALQRFLGLPSLPERIECFDISHSMGEATVASCVVFDKNGPMKQNYRRFNIENVTKSDDIAAMRQVIERRFKRLQHDDAKLPDIVIVDGGPTQLSAVKKVFESLKIKKILLLGVAKGPDRQPGYETIHFAEDASMHLPSDSLVLHFIQQIRDEAHRFAITGHRAQRDKKRRQSVLELIPGIGVKRRRGLLRYFGGIQGLAHASLDELSKVPGINHSLAERIFAALHDTTIPPYV